MAQGKYDIPAHLDDPELIGLWTLDEFLAMVLPFIWGILSQHILIGMALAAAASANAAATSGEVQKAAATVANASHVVPDSPRILSLAGLPKDGAIIWGKTAVPAVTVFSDFRCNYCRALSNELRSMNIKVIERPISSPLSHASDVAMAVLPSVSLYQGPKDQW